MRVVHAGLEESQLGLLQRAASRRGIDAVPWDAGGAADVAVLGPRLDEPIRTAQSVGRANPGAVLLLVCDPERLAAMRQAVRVTPFLGTAVQCVSAEDEQLPTLMARTLESAGRRGRTQALLAFAQASLGDRGAPAAGHLLDRLLDRAPVGVVLLSQEGRVLAWNHAASVITGTSERSAIGAGLAHALRAIDPAQVQRALEGEGRDAIEVATDGKHRFVELVPARVQLDREPGLLVIVQDVTERVQGRRELQEALRTLERRVEERTRELSALVAHLQEEVEQRRRVEARLEEAQRLARLGSWSLDRATGILSLSATLRQVLGVPPGPMAWRDLLGLVHPDHRPAVDLAFTRLQQEGRPMRLEAAVVRPDGEMRWLELQGRVGDASAARTVTGTGLDVTERRRLEEERVTAVARLKEIERLQEMDRFKTQFMNTVAHELFTPLTPISIQLHILRSRTDSFRDEEVRALDIVSRNFERLQTLVKDVLDAVRAQSGHLPMRKRPVDLSELVAQASETFVAMARERDVELKVERGPSCATEADPNRISQVLYNLVSNAVKFTPPGGEVRMRSRQEEGFCVVDVEDTGLGMTADQMARLFQPFGQVHDDSLVRGGTGLGLHISREIVELHGGTIEVASAGPGEGTRFTIRIPTLHEQPHAGASPGRGRPA